jgi:5-oxoprolinase (ATP-hydrolysing) subunit A
MKQIDLNCDMGELAEAITDGTQEALMRSITSANVACGGHAGDEEMMRATVQQALRTGVAVGAHPGYADRANFGRLELKIAADEVAESVFQQVTLFARIAEQCGARVAHVKPHGALYNQAVKNRELAQAIAKGVAKGIGGGKDQWSKNVVLVGLAGSPMLEVFRDAGFVVAAEAFADRRYEADGTLRSRKFEDALIRDPEAAAAQALDMVERGIVRAIDGTKVPIDSQTICIHGDTPGATKIAAAVAKLLKEHEVVLRSLATN